MSENVPADSKPFFSICIPQYNRTSFLIQACKSIHRQTFRDFEVCISDDCSTDGRESELLRFLKEAGSPFLYKKREYNGQYDANLRSSIELAKGKWCFLLGNDDELASPAVLEQLYGVLLEGSESVGVVITNYESIATGRTFKRIPQTGVRGKGPWVAARNFRNLSFVSGILLDTEKAKECAMDRWDGAEMYQMFLGSRIVASGMSLLGIDRIVVRQGIQIPGEQVDSYATHPRLHPCPLMERQLPLVRVGQLVVDAIQPFVIPSEKPRLVDNVVSQLFLFTYPFWIVEYRRVQSWRYSVGVCLGMRPRHVLKGLKIFWWRRWKLTILYDLVTLLGLVIPLRVFDVMQEKLYGFAKASR